MLMINCNKKKEYKAQVNILLTPEDDYFEYDLLKIDSDGEITDKDKYVILLIYYKYKWTMALYDLVHK